jgi:hypothetical protein
MKQKQLLLGAVMVSAIQLAYGFESVESDLVNNSADGGSGYVGAAIDGHKGNTNRDNYHVGARANYKARDTDMFLVAEHNRAKAYNETVEKNTWAHAHYRDAFQHALAAEAFVDYLNDDFQLLESRTQFGLGARFTMNYEENQRAVYAGLGVLHEWESQNNINDNYWRANSYINYKRQINENTHAMFNVSYQPSLNELSDYLLQAELVAVTNLTKSAALKLGVRYRYDNAQPTDVKNADTQYMTELMLRF